MELDPTCSGTHRGRLFAPREQTLAEQNPNTISDAELDVLKVLWAHGPMTIRAIRAQLNKMGRRWAYTTVQTMLNRLVDKSCARRDETTHAHKFDALISRDELVDQHVGSLMQRMCDGKATPLLLSLTHGARLDADEIAHLRRLLDELDEGAGAGDG
jgi:BlaI family transcriptional regulator, penicillinase repressor